MGEVREEQVVNSTQPAFRSWAMIPTQLQQLLTISEI